MKNFTKIALFSVMVAGMTFCPIANHQSTQVVAAEFKAIKASHILVNTENEAWALKTKITEGENFEELAKKYSKCPSGEKGGDLGFFAPGQMVPDFEEAAANTPIGEVSDPIKTKFGWHLIKVYKKIQ